MTVHEQLIDKAKEAFVLAIETKINKKIVNPRSKGF